MSEKIKITSDSSCDLTDELVGKFGIGICPIEIILGDEVKQDGINVSAEGVLDFVSKTGKLPKTAATSETRYKEFFESFVSQGYTLIHFCISSKASSCYNNAVAAAKEVGNVFVVDSMALSGGQGLEILKAADLLAEGRSAKETCEIISSSTDKLQLSFVVDTLDYLSKGGRCSSVAAIGAKLLKIHPSIYNKNGALTVQKKYSGNMTRCLSLYVQDLAAEFRNYDAKRVFVTHSPADKQLVDFVIEKVKENFKFEEIYETFAGSTVTSHCGRNTIGVIFMNK